jgi:hypothetical protein
MVIFLYCIGERRAMETDNLSVSYTAALMYGFCFAIFCTGNVF